MGVTTDQLPQEARELVEMVRRHYELGKDTHEQARRKFNRYYARYRSYKDFKAAHRSSGRRDVDDILRDGQRTFGTSLFIPYTFSVVETMLPRMVAQNPVLKIKPEEPQWEDNVEPIKLAIADRQERISYPLIMQDVGKSGLIYGLGVQKVYHDFRERKGRPILVAPTAPTDGAPWVMGKRDEVTYDGPMAECVDVFDFIWHPYAYNNDTLRWAIHRFWPDNEYIKRMVESEVWQLPAGIKLGDVLDGGSENKRDEVWADRMSAAGYTSPEKRGDHLHEGWEFHNGEKSITILDMTVPVQAGPNPHWHGEQPFQVYRPTNVLHEMVGIGEPEAIDDLNEEMNEMRTQMRDNAQLVVQRPFAYFDGLLDSADIAFGPGVGIPVDGDPREVIFPIPLQDLPASSYQETAALQRDIERVTGIDDTVSGSEGGGGASATATGVQLVQAAAGVRIANKTQRLITEIGKPTGRLFLEILQQKLTRPMTVTGPPKPEEPDRDYSYYKVGPEEMQGRYRVDVEPESTTPDNPIKDADDAQRIWNMFGQDPLMNPMKVREESLKKLGYANASGWLAPQEPEVPMHVLETVAEALAQDLGQDPDQFRMAFEELVQGALMADEEAKQGPGPQQADGPPPEPRPAG